MKEVVNMIKPITIIDTYSDGNAKDGVLHEAAEISTKYGVFIPQYLDGDRRKYTKSISFYKSGSLKSIALQEQTPIKTSAGIFPAELITFYENGSIKRIFPLNGKISGFWTEENEYELAQEFDFDFQFASFKKKIIGIQFYDCGAVKGLTFWPRDSVLVRTLTKEVSIISGFTVYPNGNLKSIEPKKPTLIDTPIGKIIAYNPNPIGIHSDNNSLEFFPDGTVKSLLSATANISVLHSKEAAAVYQPLLKPNLFDNSKMDIIPLKIDFSDAGVRFGSLNDNFYEIENYHFEIRHAPTVQNIVCGNCSACTACS